ncbi:radical SAM protein [Zhenhengia yiwuensis]|uniref:Radical SAM protein n=1 Tax=Zhenhengia yiwuensis TaxID=2763666 RepID=A0A926IEF7_9FIRM|nr:radical SAM protein [Zhenhengia yiwuensis]MBC8580747.1 radical SAM protein [Zhenhengia yiwuensis]
MKYFIKELSCLNRRDEIKILCRKLDAIGYEQVFAPEESDLSFIYTCGSVDTFVSRSAKTIEEFVKKYKEQKVIVCGCLPATCPDLLKRIFGGVTCTPTDFSALSDACDIQMTREDMKEVISSYDENMQISNIVVVKGCVRKCSYCVISRGVGSIMSKSLEKIEIEIIDQLSKGVKRFQLLGDSVGDYGIDIGLSIEDLLKRIDAIDEKFEIYIRDFHPFMFLKYYDTIRELVKKKRLVSLEVPIQSGSERILKLMNRPVDVTKLKEKLIEIAQYDCKLGTDLIVGFPSETDEDFDMTMDFIKKVHFSSISVNVYSDQPNTISSKMPEKVNKKKIFTRCMMIHDNGLNAENQEYMEYQIGKIFKVEKIANDFEFNI